MSKTRTTTRIMIIIGIITLTAGAASSAMAWGPGGCCKGAARCAAQSTGDCPGGPLADLSREQQDRLRELRTGLRDDTADARASIVAKYDQIRLLLETSEPDRARIVALADEIGTIRRSILEKRIDFVLAAKKIDPDFRAPLEGRGECILNTMGMGGPEPEGYCAGCPDRFGKRGLGRGLCLNQDSNLPGCQGYLQPQGCPGLPRTE